MAIFTGLFGKRCMHRILEKGPVCRRVGEVAVAAIHNIGRDVDVGFGENRIGVAMAFSAQRLNRLFDQRELGRIVGAVTQAAVGDVLGRVDETPDLGCHR